MLPRYLKLIPTVPLTSGILCFPSDGTDFVDTEQVRTVFVVQEFEGETFIRLKVRVNDHLQYLSVPYNYSTLNSTVTYIIKYKSLAVFEFKDKINL